MHPSFRIAKKHVQEFIVKIKLSIMNRGINNFARLVILTFNPYDIYKPLLIENKK